MESEERVEWTALEKVILLCVTMLSYTALVSSMIDVGKPSQRVAVQWLMVIGATALSRLSQIAKQSR